VKTAEAVDVWTTNMKRSGNGDGDRMLPFYIGTPNNNEDFGLPSNLWHRFLLHGFCDVQ
jgi:hypothetical protein